MTPPVEIRGPDYRASHEIAIFWDFENLALPSWARASACCQAIARKLSKYGQVRNRRIYFDFDSEYMRQSALFDSCGFDLVNTPKRNQKETLDKKLIVDMWDFAWERFTHGEALRSCVVLLTSDGDYAYSLNKLRDRGVLCIVIHGGEGSVSNVLKESADIAMSLDKDILETRTAPSSSSLDVAAVSTRRTTLCAVSLVRSLASHPSTHDGGWIPGGIASLEYGKVAPHKTSHSHTALFRAARDCCIQLGWIEQGKRVLNSPHGFMRIIASSNTMEKGGSVKDVLLGEDYLKLTEKGKIASGSSFEKEGLKSTCIFIKNVPKSVTTPELVEFIEQKCSVQILLSQAKVGPDIGNYWFARIKLANKEQATRLLNTGSLWLQGRRLELGTDTFPVAILNGPMEEIFPSEHAAIPTHALVPKASGMSTMIDSTDKNSSSAGLACDVQTLCKICTSSWASGVDLGVKFKAAVGATNSTKQRFRNAYHSAWQDGFVMVGRERSAASGHIDVSAPGQNGTLGRYKLGIFIRLSPKDTGEVDGSGLKRDCADVTNDDASSPEDSTANSVSNSTTETNVSNTSQPLMEASEQLKNKMVEAEKTDNGVTTSQESHSERPRPGGGVLSFFGLR